MGFDGQRGGFAPRERLAPRPCVRPADLLHSSRSGDGGGGAASPRYHLDEQVGLGRRDLLGLMLCQVITLSTTFCTTEDLPCKLWPERTSRWTLRAALRCSTLATERPLTGDTGRDLCH